MNDENPAFDAWLRRALNEEYGEALREPIPPEMLGLLGGQD